MSAPTIFLSAVGRFGASFIVRRRRPEGENADCYAFLAVWSGGARRRLREECAACRGMPTGSDRASHAAFAPESRQLSYNGGAMDVALAQFALENKKRV